MNLEVSIKVILVVRLIKFQLHGNIIEYFSTLTVHEVCVPKNDIFKVKIQLVGRQAPWDLIVHIGRAVVTILMTL